MYWWRILFRPFSHYRSWILNMLWTSDLPLAVLIAPFSLPPLCVCFSATALSGWFKVRFSVTSGNSASAQHLVSRSPDPVCLTALPHPPSHLVVWRQWEKEKRRGELRQLTVFSFLYSFLNFFFLICFFLQVCQSLKLERRQYRVIMPNHVVILSSLWNRMFCPHEKDSTL